MECCGAAAQQSPFVARALPINYLPCSLHELHTPNQHARPGTGPPRALRCLLSASPLASPGARRSRRGSIPGLPEAQRSGRRGTTTAQAQAQAPSGSSEVEYPPDASRPGASDQMSAMTALAKAAPSDRTAGGDTGPGSLQGPPRDPIVDRRKFPLRALRHLRAAVYLAQKQLRALTLQSLAPRLLSLLLRFRRLFLGAALLGALVLKLRSPTTQSPVPVAYSTFLSAISSGYVSSARLEPGSTRVLFNCPPGAIPERIAHSARHGSLSQPPSGGKIASPAEEVAKGTALAVAVTSGEGSAGATAARGAGQQAHCWREEVRELSPTLNRLVAPCPPPRFQFQCHRLAQDDAFLLARLLEHNTPFVAVPRSSTERMSATLAEAGILWLALAPLMALGLRLASGRNGGSNWRPFDGKKKGRGEGVGFEDVAGVDTAKAELMELVKCLRGGPGSRAASLLGATLPRGVLLVGPPGTGKTLLARAVAWESGVPFFAASGSEFVELFVGRGAARVRELFTAARRAAPAVVFIDEIDAVGSARGRGNNEEREQTLNQLLTELDGFDTRHDGVLLLAATNRLDVLDPALCRAGRISRRVQVPLPDEKGRRDILLVHLRRTACQGGPEGKLAAAAAVAAVTPGFSGAELQNVVNEAALLAAREDASEVSLMQLVEAVQRSRFGVGSRRGGGPLGTVAKWVQQAALQQLARPKAT